VSTIKKLLELLSPLERKRLVKVLGMVIIMALLEMLGVVSILPFMAVLANPDLIYTNTLLSIVFTTFNFQSTQSFLFTLGLLVFIFLVISLSFKAVTIYIQLRFTMMLEHSIGKRLVEGYLHQPYSWFLNRNSADLNKVILSEVSNVVNSGMLPLMNLIAYGGVVSALLILLIFINPVTTFVVFIILGVAYGLIFKYVRRSLARIGKEHVEANQERFIAVTEAFGAFREIKVGGLEHIFISRFSEPTKTFASHQATAQVISQLPRFVLEVLAFGGILLIILHLMSQGGNFINILPIVALYVFAGYRLMPALQQIYGASTQLRFVGPALNNLQKDMNSLYRTNKSSESSVLIPKQSIKMTNLNFSYPNMETLALKNINLFIKVPSVIGIVGATGSGKTTIVDLMLGLLEPQSGTLSVDGEQITANNCRAWQRVIGYVPQQIYLTDDSVAANIAFGVNPKQVSQEAVERAAKIANLHDFIVNDLPLGYATKVGERGVRLSGGQRQRIGIARALYHNPRVLILDEATSALDNYTERAFMKSVYNLREELTIIMIAHRLSTIENCDHIFLLENGFVKDEGTFQHLVMNNNFFKQLSAKNNQDHNVK